MYCRCKEGGKEGGNNVVYRILENDCNEACTIYVHRAMAAQVHKMATRVSDPVCY